MISYKDIFKISAPIIVGSAAQNVITLMDSVFLFHLSELDFAAIGFVGVFYLIIASIGYGFSKGAQIVIARFHGKESWLKISLNFHSLIVIELFLATFVFFIVQNMAPYIFDYFLQSEHILERSLLYIRPRLFGIFASYIGVALISFYTGLARTQFILIDTLFLMLVNLFLNYTLIFGHFNFPQLGIAGAAWASTIAEYLALALFILLFITDKKLHHVQMLKFSKISMQSIQIQVQLSLPIVVQLMVGMGSWFIFFSIIENLGSRALAISNLARIVYLFLSIPVWGYSSTINTLVSQYIGAGKGESILHLVWKVSRLSAVSVILFALPVMLFPSFFLYPIFGGSQDEIILDSRPILYIVSLTLLFMSVGSLFFNGVTGAGATTMGLIMQTSNAIIYLIIIYMVVNVWQLGLYWAWSVEIIYWILTLIMSILYLRSDLWKKINF